ncbi:MAG: lactate utilization protein [Firmicutes bacterium]|nr:lactate utilization protein [Bacillota bacterium]MCL5038512.1 lactate utilization protein [Bacillota bacterium]
MEQQERLFWQFKKKAELLSAQVLRFPDLKPGWPILAEILAGKGVKRVVCPVLCNQIKGWPSPELTAGGLTVFFREEEVLEQAAQADAGIIGPALAVAETGSLLQIAEDVSRRLAGMLPPIVVALVSTRQLVANLEEAFSYLEQLPQIPGYLSFISGPSRTADIERTLTLGVHGPRELIIAFLDEAGVQIAGV